MKEEKKLEKPKCSAPDEGCLGSGCCSSPGMTCYEKVPDQWAQCRVSCNAGPDPVDIDNTSWTCKALGPQTPGPAPVPNYALHAAAWVQEYCAGPGEDCSKSKCCKEGGKQCYTKARGWSACKAECIPDGPDPVDSDDHPWECKELGMRTPGAASGWGVKADWVDEKCAGTFENCKHSKCCKEPGNMCYKKTEAWSMCMPKCTPGPLLTDADAVKWNCTKLGGRTPGLLQTTGNHQVAGWVKDKCSKSNENCRDTWCCSEPTMQCYEKDDWWAGCLRGCVESPHKDDKDGGNWTCNKLGMRTPREWKHPSLYCFHVMRMMSYEAAIVRQSIATEGGIGIFSCEIYDVFASDGEGWLGDGPMGQVRPHHFTAAPVTRSVDGTAGNTALFMNVWEAVKWVGNWEYADWTIKADPDAVIFPDRLRAHLRHHNDAPTPHGQFIINCVKPLMSPMMFGSVEALSKKALRTYFSREGECRSGYQYGEDRWLDGCLRHLGVQGTQDFNLVGDKVCAGAACGDRGKAAFHSFKDAGSWMGCYNQAIR